MRCRRLRDFQRRRQPRRADHGGCAEPRVPGRVCCRCGQLHDHGAHRWHVHLEHHRGRGTGVHRCRCRRLGHRQRRRGGGWDLSDQRRPRQHGPRHGLGHRHMGPWYVGLQFFGHGGGFAVVRVVARHLRRGHPDLSAWWSDFRVGHQRGHLLSSCGHLDPVRDGYPHCGQPRHGLRPGSPRHCLRGQRRGRLYARSDADPVL